MKYEPSRVQNLRAAYFLLFVCGQIEKNVVVQLPDDLRLIDLKTYMFPINLLNLFVLTGQCEQ